MYIIVTEWNETYVSDNLPSSMDGIIHVFDIEAKKEYVDGVWLEIEEYVDGQ